MRTPPMSEWPDKKPGGLDASEKTSFAKGVFRKCDGCGETMPAETLESNFEVCPHCNQHHRLPAFRWRELLLDDGVIIRGTNQGKTVFSALSAAKRWFEWTSSGTFTWK